MDKLLEDDVLDIEQLIVDGSDARVPLEVEFPVYKNGELQHKKYLVLIRPLKSSELNNATQMGLKNPNTDVNTEIVKIALITKDGEPYPSEVVENLPAGVINKLTEHICEISGLQTDKEANAKLIREMMGF